MLVLLLSNNKRNLNYWIFKNFIINLVFSGHITSVAGEGFPEIVTIPKWDGKDAEVPKMEEVRDFEI